METVEIIVRGGVAEVYFQTKNVEVDIYDYDNLGPYILSVYCTVKKEDRDDYGNIYDSQKDALYDAMTNKDGYEFVRQGYCVFSPEEQQMPADATDILFSYDDAIKEAYRLGFR